MAPTPIRDLDVSAFHAGTHRRLHHVLGAHPDATGTWFALWAPAAASVEVVGDFNGWRPGSALAPLEDSGIWTGHAAGATTGHAYRYVVTNLHGERADWTDPVAAAHRGSPATASVIADLSYEWDDERWMAGRSRSLTPDAPVSILQVSLGSPEGDGSTSWSGLDYRQLAEAVADHATTLGFTHVALQGLLEPLRSGSDSDPYTGQFAPTVRHGSPTELMGMIDRLHRRGVGVIIDWAPSRSAPDTNGLARPEVRSHLVSSVMSWLERYHADGICVDAIASVLYLDYSRQPDTWVPNAYGGRENRPAIEWLQELNTAILEEFPDTATFAEESTSWPGVTASTHDGGLGFTYKSDTGWAHDTLQYLARDPVHRQFHHDEITFRTVYAFGERYVLALSLEGAAPGAGSLSTAMPGDEWQRFANLRLLYAMMWAQPGKKRLSSEHEPADHTTGIAGVHRLVADLNRMYRAEPALHRSDADPDGFDMVVGDDETHSVFAWLRRDPTGAGPAVLVVVNATPVVHYGYRVGVPSGGRWQEVLNTDAVEYGGSGIGNLGAVATDHQHWHRYHQSLALTVPPLAVVYMKEER